ncbi:MAG: hypothetical protein AVDCRST_MAG89-4934, partial [uncultured Gemmatimonadetes bacterium]
ERQRNAPAPAAGRQHHRRGGGAHAQHAPQVARPAAVLSRPAEQGAPPRVAGEGGPGGGGAGRRRAWIFL